LCAGFASLLVTAILVISQFVGLGRVLMLLTLDALALALIARLKL